MIENPWIAVAIVGWLLALWFILVWWTRRQDAIDLVEMFDSNYDSMVAGLRALREIRRVADREYIPNDLEYRLNKISTIADGSVRQMEKLNEVANV